jgi:hypothetical protein
VVRLALVHERGLDQLLNFLGQRGDLRRLLFVGRHDSQDPQVPERIRLYVTLGALEPHVTLVTELASTLSCRLDGGAVEERGGRFDVLAYGEAMDRAEAMDGGSPSERLFYAGFQKRKVRGQAIVAWAAADEPL